MTEPAGPPPASHPEPPATPPVDRPTPTIQDVSEARRYEARIGDQLVGWVDYGRVGSRMVAIHTEVPPEFGGRGIASSLVRRMIDDARAAGATITPRCPLFAAHFRRHPEDKDVLATRVPRG